MAPLKPQEKGFHCKRAARRAAMLADCTAHSAAEPRWMLLYDLACFYYPLPLCQSRSGVAESPSTGTLLNAASASNAAFGKQSAAKQTSLAPHDSKARLMDISKRRDSWRSHVRRTYIAQRVQSFKLQTANVRGRGELPSRSLGGLRGPFSHAREWPPYPRPLHSAGKNAPLRVRREQYNTVC